MSWPAVASETPISFARFDSMPITMNSEQPSAKPMSTRRATHRRARPGVTPVTVSSTNKSPSEGGNSREA